MIPGRPVTPRARRRALMAASVPEDTSRTISTPGTASTMGSSDREVAPPLVRAFEGRPFAAIVVPLCPTDNAGASEGMVGRAESLGRNRSPGTHPLIAGAVAGGTLAESQDKIR